MTMTTNSTVEELLAMADADFKAIVEKDIRSTVNKSIGAALRTPEVVPRWYNHLTRIRTSVEGQLRSRELKMEQERIEADILGLRGAQKELQRQEAAHLDWVRRISTFKQGVEVRLTEVRWLLAQLRPDVESLVEAFESYDKIIERGNQLYLAIQRHRDNFPSDDEPSEEDERLWAVIA